MEIGYNLSIILLVAIVCVSFNMCASFDAGDKPKKIIQSCETTGTFMYDNRGFRCEEMKPEK